MGAGRKRPHGAAAGPRDTEKVWPADLVLLAMGFLGPEDTVLSIS